MATNFSQFVQFVSIQSNRLESTTFSTQPLKSRSTIFSKSRANQLSENDSCRFDKIGFMNQFLVCRIANTKDESTLVGCIGQPSCCAVALRAVYFPVFVSTKDHPLPTIYIINEESLDSIGTMSEPRTLCPILKGCKWGYLAFNKETGAKIVGNGTTDVILFPL